MFALSLNIAIDIAIDINIDINYDIKGDMMFNNEKDQINDEIHEHMRFHRRNFLRHNAMVPKGFLRYHVLEALNEKPMSGSELMDQLQKHTGGTWKPSPGSIYPLLAWLQDNAYVKEIPTENGLKRYELTQTGKDFLAEQTKMREKWAENARFMASPIFDRMFGNIPEKRTSEIQASMKRFFVSSTQLARLMREHYSEKDLDEALKVLDEASSKLQAINNRLAGEKHE